MKNTKRPKDKFFKIQIDGILGQYWLVVNERFIENVKQTAWDIIHPGLEKIISDPQPTSKKFFDGVRPFHNTPGVQAYRVCP